MRRKKEGIGELMSEPQRDVQQAIQGRWLAITTTMPSCVHSDKDRSVAYCEPCFWVMLAKLAAPQWQPIESAPKPIVGSTPHDSEAWKSFLVWCPENLCQYLVVRRGERFSVMGGGLLEVEPTHWMPRMPAPDAEKPGA